MHKDGLEPYLAAGPCVKIVVIAGVLLVIFDWVGHRRRSQGLQVNGGLALLQRVVFHDYRLNML